VSVQRLDDAQASCLVVGQQNASLDVEGGREQVLYPLGVVDTAIELFVGGEAGITVNPDKHPELIGKGGVGRKLNIRRGTGGEERGEYRKQVFP